MMKAALIFSTALLMLGLAAAQAQGTAPEWHATWGSPAKAESAAARAQVRRQAAVQRYRIPYRQHRRHSGLRPSQPPNYGMVRRLPQLPQSGHDYLRDYIRNR